MIWLELCTTYSSSCHHHFHNPLLQQTPPNPGSPGKWPLKRRDRERICNVYVCTYVCLYVCMYVCLYVCLYVLVMVWLDIGRPATVTSLESRSLLLTTTSTITETLKAPTTGVTGNVLHSEHYQYQYQHQSWIYIVHHCSVAWWRSGSGAGLVIKTSRVQIPATPPSSATLGKLLTHMCLCHQTV